MTLIAPGSSHRKRIEEIMNTVSEQQYYTVCKVPLTKLISVEFIEAFVKQGCQIASNFIILYCHYVLLCTVGLFFYKCLLTFDI